MCFWYKSHESIHTINTKTELKLILHIDSWIQKNKNKHRTSDESIQIFISAGFDPPRLIELDGLILPLKLKQSLFI